MIFCFKHQNYVGKVAPEISCKTCCHIFISEIKRCRDNGEALPVTNSWYEKSRNKKRKYGNSKRIQVSKFLLSSRRNIKF